MTENGWKAIGRIAKARRERLGLKQDQLGLYGGPGVSTVGKFERAAQESFPLRTQHQMENALGWSRTTIEQVVNSINENALSVDDWEHDLIHENVPDLSRPVTSIPEEDSASTTRGIEAFATIFRLLDPERLDEALRAALLAILPFLSHDGAVRLGDTLREAFPPKGGDGNAEDSDRGPAPTKEPEAGPANQPATGNVRELKPWEVDEAAYPPDEDETDGDDKQ